jgi:hypothetical protein
MRNGCARATIGLVLAVALLAGAAWADEVLDEINEAVRLYEAGDLSGAVSSLDFAAQQIREQMAGEVATALPAPLPGWEAQDAETSALGGAMFGGGISAQRTYTKGDASVDVQIVGQSPMLQMVVGMLNNPMMLSSGGKKAIKIKGNRGSLEYDAAENTGEIQVVVANSVLVTINGTDVSQEDLTAYAEAVDYAKIEASAGQ